YALHMAPLVVLEHGGERVALPQGVAAVRPRARAGGPAHVADHRSGRVYYPVAEEPEPPAEVDVLEIGEEVGVEPARVEEGAPVRHHSPARGEEERAPLARHLHAVGPAPGR